MYYWYYTYNEPNIKLASKMYFLTLKKLNKNGVQHLCSNSKGNFRPQSNAIECVIGGWNFALYRSQQPVAVVKRDH